MSDSETKYPEHERMRAVHDLSQKLGAFLEWLESGDRRIAEYHEHGEKCEGGCGMVARSDTGRYHSPALYVWEPDGRGDRIERTLAMYFEIDLEKIRAEKDAMYGALVADLKAAEARP